VIALQTQCIAPAIQPEISLVSSRLSLHL